MLIVCITVFLLNTVSTMAIVTSDTVKISTCKNEKVTLRPGGGIKFKWQDGSTASSFDVVADGNKMVSVTVVYTVDTSKLIFAIVPINCNINAGPDISICKGLTTKLTATTNGTFKEWTPVTNLSTPTTLSTNANPQTTIKYVASAIFPSQNLIINGDFEKGFEDFSSDYVYGDTILKYGYYVVGKNPNPYESMWARNFTDHTSGSGRMMIVDGSEIVGQDVYRTTVFVHKGSNYVFSTWIKNVKEGLENPAKLRFYINGQAFGSINLPDGEANWVYFNTFWTAPSDTTITISIKNQNTNGFGNDFAFDDLVFADYVTITDTMLVTVNPIPNVTATASKPSICVGQSVTLTGNNASTYVWNKNVINTIAFKPTTTDTYNITGTDGNGCKNTSSVSVVVNALPTIKTVANPTTICLGDSSTLTASGGLTYIWSNANANGASLFPTSTQTYSVSGTDSKGCVNTASAIITVNPLPTITATSQTICLGKSTVLNALGASSYIWDNGVINNVSFSPTSTKTYSVTGTDLKSCSNTSTASVIVNQLPVVSVVTGPTILCVGQSTIVSGQGAQSYIWDNLISDNISFTPTATKTYTVTGTDGNGCVNTSSVSVVVNQLPTISALNQTICLGQTTKLQGVGGFSYVWGGGISNNIDFNPTSTSVYTVTGTDINGCQNTASASVTVNPLPTITATSQTICLGKSTVLNALGASSYIWDNGVINNASFFPTSTKTYSVTGTDLKSCSNTSTASVIVNQLPVVSVVTGPTILCVGQSTRVSGQGAQSYIWDNLINDNISFTPTATKTYTVTGTDGNGCVNTSSVSVVVNALPTIKTVANPTTICLGESSTLTASGGLTYIWSNANANGASLFPTSTQTYSVSGTDSKGCVNTASAIITVNPLPTITATSQTICLGKSTELNALGASSYIWDNGVINNASFSPTSTKTYSVTGTDLKSCSNTSTASVIVNQLPVVSTVSKTICIGQAVIIEGNGAVSYVWDKNVWNGISFTPSITDTYTVTGTDANGCTNTASATVTLNPLPTISANSETVCDGQSTTLRANGAVSYIWDGGITNNVSFIPNSSSKYHVTGTDVNGCKNETVTTVVVNPLPVLAYGAIPQICDYANPVNIDYATPIGGSYSGLGVSGLMFDPSIAGTGVNAIKYSYSDANGCTNTISQSITVNTKPVLIFNLDAQRCYDAGLLQLNANPSGGKFSGIGIVGQTFNPTIPTSEVPIPISYGYTDPTTGCTDTLTKNIIVHYTPPPIVHNVQTSTIALQTSIPAIGDGTMKWYDNPSLSKLLYVGNPYFHGYTNPVYRYYYITQVINGCESISDTMIFRIVSCGTPAPIVNSPTIKCMYQNLDTVKVQNTTINNRKATVIWRDVNDVIVSNSAAFAPNFNSEGSVTYQVFLDTSSCEGAGVNVTWDRYKTPKPVIAPIPSPCHGFAIPSFTATNIHGMVKWYNNATLDTLVGTGNSFKTKDLNTILQYYWVTNNDMCVSDPVRVQLVIFPKPAPPVGYALYESCQGSPIITMSVTPSDGTTWYDTNNQIIGSNLPSYIPPVATLKLDQKIRYSTIYFDGNCYSDPFTFDYLLKRKPLKPKLHADTICINSKRVELELASGNNVTWNFPALQKQYNGLKIKPDITTMGIFTYNVWDELNGCNSDTASNNVVAGPTPQNTIVGPTKICENTYKQPFSVTSRNDKSSFLWTVTGNRVNYRAMESAQFYRNVDFIEPGIDTIYVTETNEFGCSGKDSVIVRIAPKPLPDFLAEVPNENYKFNFTNSTDSLYITDGKYKELLSLSFNWNFGRETDTLVAEMWKQYLKDTVYKQNYAFGTYKVLLIANPEGYQCADSITKQIYVDIKEALFVPNAFSPDHPSPNLSVFTAKGFNLKSFKMWIYDYWGNLIFYTDKLYNGQPLEGWDGSFNGVTQKVDTYVWKVEAEFLDGVYWKGQAGAKTEGKVTFGNLLLIR